MPNASAPNAPWVEVWRVAADDGHARLGEPELRADDVHDALLGVAQRVQPDAELRAVACAASRPACARPGRRSAGRCRSSGRCGPRWRASGRAGGPGGRPAAARRRPAGWSPRGRGAGRCRAGPARPSARRTTCASQTFSASVRATVLLLGPCDLRLSMLRRQYRCMDNSSGVGVLDKAALVLGRPRGRPGQPGRARRRRPAWPDRPRTGWRSRSSTTGWSPATCRAGSSSARGCASWPRPPARTGCSPRPARCSPGCATSPARARSSTAARATAGSASPPPSGCTGLRDTVPVGAALTMTAGSAAQVLLAWEEPDRLHRGLREARFTATALLGASAGAAGRRASASASRASRRCPRRCVARGPGGRGGVGLRADRAADPPAGSAACADRLRGSGQAERGPAAPAAGPAGRPTRPVGATGAGRSRQAQPPRQGGAAKSARQPA